MSNLNANSKQQSGKQEPELHFKRLPVWEFVCIIASLMALNATAVDIMLPALGDIQNVFKFEDDNLRQQVVIVYLMGMGISQIFYGPLIDRFGRRPILIISLSVYMLASIACLMAPSFEMLIWARIAQGASAGAIRVVAAAVARDCYSGRAMAEIMSIVMLIFMAAPILAPSIGQGILLFGDWRTIFWALVIYSGIMTVWSYFRLPETLNPKYKTPLQPKRIAKSYHEFFTNKLAVGYSVSSAFIFGALFSYISASEQIYSETFHKGDNFPLWFAGTALGMAIANLLNSKLVGKYGMRRLSHASLILMLGVNATYAVIASSGNESFILFYIFVFLSFLCLGFIGPNFSAIGMEPVGHIAGTASALYGFSGAFLAALFGGWIASRYDGTLAPIYIGNTISIAIGLGLVFYTEKGRLFQIGSQSQ